MSFTADQLPAIAQRIIDSQDADPYRMAWATWIIANSRAAADERERIAKLLDAEHEKRKHLDNHAAFYARMIRESA